MKYRFVLVPPPTAIDTKVDIYDCLGGSSPYVVKHDRIHETWECSCPDYGFRRRRAHEHCVHIRSCIASKQAPPVAS